MGEQTGTIEARRVRFDSIEGLQRRDLGIAGEVWLRDVCGAKWASREVMKLAAHLVRYMSIGDPRLVLLSRIEHQVQITKEDVHQALRLMRLYRAVEAYSVEGEELRAALHLSTLQRLAVLETRYRLDFLIQQNAVGPGQMAGAARWVPAASGEGTEPEAAVR